MIDSMTLRLALNHEFSNSFSRYLDKRFSSQYQDMLKLFSLNDWYAKKKARLVK